jgi:uncharacterized protein YjbJ (UPF0337 family)
MSARDRIDANALAHFALGSGIMTARHKQLTGKVKEQWGKLTDDDIAQVNGNREQLEGKIQARYGYAKDQVKKDVDDWLGRQ